MKFKIFGISILLLLFSLETPRAWSQDLSKFESSKSVLSNLAQTNLSRRALASCDNLNPGGDNYSCSQFCEAMNTNPDGSMNPDYAGPVCVDLGPGKYKCECCYYNDDPPADTLCANGGGGGVGPATASELEASAFGLKDF
ncbi:MAG: hypothetical protein J0M12_11825 [Deltaproteobacteria bacterium]|nr:hypothetical protein [Deltaproteobacteria bacterium]